ncbi:cobyrinic acid a,c-diamide synthase [Gordonia araii NBRC 100433]|uniref:Hydrogenobyrinate a,c-diamide synthase n=1 Tax=Gordonia araii NBRC 100433 TaxID=1073574 RepID=G7H4Z2_9ACTN|nr:cobyrinate a,c-diamide synthase [Gordonia araii]NNG96607.1 cobyrinate a,c-diamide synthase [Gordonia araii NBRC 100433]GAB10917.1 cobyrinic acid a,c-diamide synthase [Gordonia araii NBRC 100433]
MTGIPTVVIAAPSSGSGKTTVTTGLVGALRAAGRVVAPFKVGPDYIDPGYHALAAGRPGRNLDPNLVGDELVAPLFAAGAAGADIAVVEGVMGLFDGRITAESPAGGYGSTAHVAKLLGAPVILVVDVAGHSQSLAALLHGFASFDTGVRLAGVILNRVGSERHEEVVRAAAESVGLPVVGVLRRDDALSVPSRHLGLIPAAERTPEARDAVAAMTALAAATVDLDAVTALARPVSVPRPWSPAEAVGEPVAGEPVVAVAAGRAFTFGYPEHAELLTAAGARVVEFDPLAQSLPADTAAVVLGGGFPEEHADELSANRPLREAVRAHVAAGRPVHAECAGYLYLTGGVIRGGRPGPELTAVLRATAEFRPRLTLGYRDAVALRDSVLYRSGDRVTGHEFHRATVDPGPQPAWGWRAEAVVVDGHVHGGVHASFLHVHPASVPAAMRRFVAAAAGHGENARGMPVSLSSED